MIDRIGDPPDTLDLADNWCRGYVAGMALRADEWEATTQTPEITESLTPILLLADPEEKAKPDPLEQPEEYAAVMDELAQSAVDIYEWWRTPRTIRRSTPKVSANAPCPCCSGRKYKRCCSRPRAVSFALRQAQGDTDKAQATAPAAFSTGANLHRRVA